MHPLRFTMMTSCCTTIRGTPGLMRQGTMQERCQSREVIMQWPKCLMSLNFVFNDLTF